MKKLAWKLLCNILILGDILCILFYICPATYCMLLSFLGVGIVIYVVYCFYNPKNSISRVIHWKQFLLDALVLLFLAIRFYNRWSRSMLVSTIALSFHLSKQNFLFAIICSLGYFSLYSIDYIIQKVAGWLERYKVNKRIRALGLIIIIESLVLQYSSMAQFPFSLNECISFEAFGGNIAFVLLVNLSLNLFFNNKKVSLCISTFAFCLFGIINYYTILYHGSPLMFSEFANVITAFNVAGSYSFTITWDVVLMVFCCVLLLRIVLGKDGDTPIFDGKEFGRKRTLLLGGIILLCTGTGYWLSNSNISSKNSWYSEIARHGFCASFINDIRDRTTLFICPEGYTSDSLPTVDAQSGSTEELPDIIMILNESFCDLSEYTIIGEDEDYLYDFYNIAGARYGKAIVPFVGGGTNNSEYELLFSNSMYLLSNGAPFTYLSPEQEKRSIVSYLKNLGYETTAMHCAVGANYSRDKAYKNMGFDYIYLGAENFSYLGKNGNRSWTDMDNYQDLISHYNEMSNSPQFMYLLTFQNHGGYEQNDDSFDTVHTNLDFGDLTDDINEYLSSLQLSVEAFSFLTEYFSNSDRKTIICMVGDHAPSFISQLSAKSEPVIQNDSINKRTVPYVIWSNFQMGSDIFTEYTSMVDLVPMVLKSADIPLSTYYSYILSLHEEIPIRTSDGINVDREYGIWNYGENTEKDEPIRIYYFLEYNSLLSDDEFKAELFN